MLVFIICILYFFITEYPGIMHVHLREFLMTDF